MNTLLHTIKIIVLPSFSRHKFKLLSKSCVFKACQYIFIDLDPKWTYIAPACENELGFFVRVVIIGQLLKLFLCGVGKTSRVHRDSVDSFHIMFGSDGKQLGGVRIVAFFISSHERTQ